MTPYASGKDWTLYHGDCLEVLPTLSGIDAVVTDPPYLDRPDLFDTSTTVAAVTFCVSQWKSLVFWQANGNAPWDADVTHVWHKSVPIHRGSVVGNVPGHQFERILSFGCGGCSKVFRCAAMLRNFKACQDELVDHPTQKPTELLVVLLEKYTKPSQTVLDPFTGSGTTGVACIRTGRKFIGIELDEGYCEIAAKRMTEAESHLFRSIA